MKKVDNVNVLAQIVPSGGGFTVGNTIGFSFCLMLNFVGTSAYSQGSHQASFGNLKAKVILFGAYKLNSTEAFCGNPARH